MLRSSSAWMALLASLLAGCAHYESGEGYRGAGSFRVPSDYSQTVASTTPPTPENEPPRGPFQLQWPVRKVHINRGFRPRSDRHHQGIDLGGHRGTPILAAHPGTVIYAGHRFHGYGNMVLLEFDHHWATLYAHMSRIEVKEGQQVSTGEEIGKMGRTGHATGNHLHFELMENHLPIDPLPFLTPLRQLSSN